MKSKNRVVLVIMSLVVAACQPGNTPEAPQEPSTAAAPAAALETPARSPLPAMGLACNIERVGSLDFKAGPPVVAPNGAHRLSGWFIDEAHGVVPPDGKLILLGGGDTVVRSQQIVMWRSRPDVVHAKGGQQGYSESGFAVDVDFKGVPAGTYRLILSSGTGDRARECDVDRLIRITGG